MKLKDAVRAVQLELPITQRMDSWLAANPNPVYSERAIEHAKAVFANEVGGNAARRMPFRSSSVGMCARRRLFAAAGVPERGTVDAHLGNIFATGNFLHLKWQMAGLTEGWLAEAEVRADYDTLLFGGTLDGIIFDGSGFEFKTIHSAGFSQVMAYGPRQLHVRQMHSYMLIRPDITKFSIIYENKDNGDWREFRVEKDPKMMKEIDRELGELVEHYHKRSLPKMLPDCETKEGKEYRNCPFNEVCPTIKKWPVIIEGRVIS